MPEREEEEVVVLVLQVVVLSAHLMVVTQLSSYFSYDRKWKHPKFVSERNLFSWLWFRFSSCLR